MEPEISKIERTVFEYVKAYCRDHGGLGPSYLDLMGSLDMSKPRLQYILINLKEKGYVTWRPRMPRTLSVLK